MCKIITTRKHDSLHKNFNVQFLKLLILVIEAAYIDLHVKFKVIKLFLKIGSTVAQVNWF